jgi:hypothetical protein
MEATATPIGVHKNPDGPKGYSASVQAETDAVSQRGRYGKKARRTQEVTENDISSPSTLTSDFATGTR